MKFNSNIYKENFRRNYFWTWKTIQEKIKLIVVESFNVFILYFI